MTLGCTVAELQARMSSREFSEWQAYAQVEPIGALRADLRNAMLMTLIANIYRDPKKRPEPFTPAEFLPFYEAEAEEKRAPEPGQLWAKLKAWAMANRGR